MKPWPNFCGMAWRAGFWFRVRGYGLVVCKSAPLFSERSGCRKVLRVRGWKMELLRPGAGDAS
jgi:hypothetical protein